MFRRKGQSCCHFPNPCWACLGSNCFCPGLGRGRFPCQSRSWTRCKRSFRWTTFWLGPKRLVPTFPHPSFPRYHIDCKAWSSPHSDRSHSRSWEKWTAFRPFSFCGCSWIFSGTISIPQFHPSCARGSRIHTSRPFLVGNSSHRDSFWAGPRFVQPMVVSSPCLSSFHAGFSTFLRFGWLKVRGATCFFRFWNKLRTCFTDSSSNLCYSCSKSQIRTGCILLEPRAGCRPKWFSVP